MMMTNERLQEIEENAKWIRMDAANNGEEREYVLAVDAVELIAEVRSLRAKLDECRDANAAYYHRLTHEYTITEVQP